MLVLILILILILIVPVIGMAIALERDIARGFLVGAIKEKALNPAGDRPPRTAPGRAST